MIKHSAAYSQAVVGQSRRQYARAVFDLFDPDMVVDAITVSDESVQSKKDQLPGRGTDETNQKAVTLEHGRWVLNGTWETIDPSDLTGQRGWENDTICDANGVFAEPFPYVEETISNTEILQAVSLQFSAHAYNGVPEDFTVEVLSGDMVLASKDFTGNTASRVVFDGFTANYPTKIRLAVKKWSIGNRRARIIRMLPGLYETWDGDVIRSIDILTESTFSGLSLPYSSCDVEIYNEDKRFDPYAPNSIFKSIEERQAVSFEMGMRLEDGSVEWLPAGTYHQQSGGWSLADLTVKWNLVDIIGMLTSRRFVVPSSLPTTLSGWVEAIMASIGVNFRQSYIVEEDVASLPLKATKEAVTGSTCGDLLRYACMATNTWPRQDMATGKLRVGKVERIEGNEITVDAMPSHMTMAENEAVSDITFTLDKGEVTFPGTNTESNQSLSVSNPFVHTEEDARKAVLSCLLEYGGKKFTAESRGNPSSETGDIMSIDTQFGTQVSARLFKQQLKLDQGVMRNVSSELVQSPNDAVTVGRVLLTGGGTWNAPEGVTKIKVTLISGGTGGQGGGGGVMTDDTGWDVEETTGGNPGDGGKVLIAEISINPGQGFAYSCGAGGAAGKGGSIGNNGGMGEAGQPTTFGQLTSASGTVYANGMMDIQTGAVYASTGGKNKTGYGCGGEGGKQGSDGYQYQVKGENGIWHFVTATNPTPGTDGTPGKDGCIIVEW